jgi:hypothetical protein
MMDRLKNQLDLGFVSFAVVLAEGLGPHTARLVTRTPRPVLEGHRDAHLYRDNVKGVKNLFYST